MQYGSTDEIGDNAAHWVVRMDAGTWTNADETELQAWFAEDVRHRGELLRAQAAWMTLDPVAEEAHGRWRPTVAMPRRFFLAGAGGALAASIISGIVWSSAATAYSTDIGEIRRVPLSDGSTATINSDSEIRVKFKATERSVRLQRGEAWFQVAKDAHRPFVVKAGQVVAQAVGTAFSVRRRDQGADILVTEGVVEVWAAQADGHRVRLLAGQSAFVRDNAAIHVKTGGPAALERALAWRDGSIDLAGETLAEAIDTFNRYNTRKLVLADPRLARERFDGVFHTNDPEGFALVVRGSLDVPVDRSDPSFIRIGRPR
jgi:transmembrane sensor